MFGLAAALASAAASAEPISVTTQPIESFAPAAEDATGDAGTRAGALQFLGGIVVNSDDARFGGLSGIDLLDADHALMVGDRGAVVRARLVRENGRLVGLADVEIDPFLPEALAGQGAGDIEDVALDPADRTRGMVVRERQANAMLSFALQNGRVTGVEPQRVGAPDNILRSNTGLESVAYAPPASPLAGQVIAIAERARSGTNGIPGWIAGVGQFSIVPHDDFDVSGARFLPDGDLILLERRFQMLSGIAIRLRRIPGDSIAVGARLDGEILLEAGMASQIDNMEGIAVHRDAEGRVILTLVSDDNFSILQRTLILEFALAED